MKLTVKLSNLNSELTVDIADLAISVADFKRMLAERCPIPAPQQRLIYKGHVLRDAQMLDSLGLADGHVLHLVKAAAPAAAATTTTTPTATTAAAQPDTAAMAAMFDNPMVQQMLSNPELLRQLMMSNPQMRALVDRNPELAHVLNDPQLLRQTLEYARNPALMQEMLRSSDRALSNLEAVPEGFNAIRRVFTDYQQPILDALDAQHAPPPAAATTATTTTPPPAPGAAPNAQPLPNPWTAPQAQQQQPAMPAGLGDMLGGMGGAGMPDPQTMISMLQNPAMQQMMQQLFSNPEFVQQMMQMNPMARQMMDANPQMREMFTNPQFLQALANPQTLQAILQLQQAFGGVPGMGGDMGGLAGLAGMGGMPGMPPMPGMPTTTTPPAQQPSQQQPAQPPEERFRDQLQQLEEMGFLDRERNLRALAATSGNVQWAIERLLSM